MGFGAEIRWPAQLMNDPDGLGAAAQHVGHIITDFIEALIRHLKLISHRFHVAAGQTYAKAKPPGGKLGCHLVSDGSRRPYWMHFRDPSSANLQAIPTMRERCTLAEVIAAIASIDSVVGMFTVDAFSRATPNAPLDIGRGRDDWPGVCGAAVALDQVPFCGPARTGDGGVMLALHSRPNWTATRPASSPNSEHPSGAREKKVH